MHSEFRFWPSAQMLPLKMVRKTLPGVTVPRTQQGSRAFSIKATTLCSSWIIEWMCVLLFLSTQHLFMILLEKKIPQYERVVPISSFSSWSSFRWSWTHHLASAVKLTCDGPSKASHYPGHGDWFRDGHAVHTRIELSVLVHCWAIHHTATRKLFLYISFTLYLEQTMLIPILLFFVLAKSFP